LLPLDNGEWNSFELGWPGDIVGEESTGGEGVRIADEVGVASTFTSGSSFTGASTFTSGSCVAPFDSTSGRGLGLSSTGFLSSSGHARIPPVAVAAGATAAGASAAGGAAAGAAAAGVAATAAAAGAAVLG